MKKISRRKAIGTTGLAVGAYLAGKFMPPVGASPQGNDINNQAEHIQWCHVQLNPEEVAVRAYEFYEEGSCMYASFKALSTSMSEAVANTNAGLSRALRILICHMMKYGHSGLGGQGTLCGAINGAAAMFGLFIKEKSTLDALIAELCSFYESAELPVFRPENSKFEPMPQSVAGSVLCHISQTVWCQKSRKSPFSKFRSDRCKRLTADIAAMAAHILNRYAEGGLADIGLHHNENQRCLDCHGPEGPVVRVSAKMNCLPCHGSEDHYE